MASTISQKEYLRKYLSGGSKDAKKKKKKRIKGAGIKIIDDDTDVSRIRPLQDSELELLLDDEDAPQVAGIIDERPEEVRKAEEFKSMSKWKVINEDDGFNSRVRIEEIKSKINRADNENDSDASPPRKFRQTQNDDSDQSPIRHKDNTSKRHKNNSKDTDSDLSPPRSKSNKQVQLKASRQSDSDASPPRKSRRQESPDNSGKQNSYSGRSPPRKRSDNASNKRRSSDSDPSPPRKTSANKTEMRRKESRWGKAEADIPKTVEQNRSPPRNLKPFENRNRNYQGKNYERDRTRRKSSSDPSPPRRTHRERSPERGYDRRRNQRSAGSPPSTNKKMESNRSSRKSSSDPSPPRRTNRERTPERRYDRKGNQRNADSPPPTNKKMEKTLEGKQAGLQNAKELMEENRRFKDREDDIFKKMSGDVSGRYAEVATRKSGKKREKSVDKEKQREEQEKQKARDEKYSRWGKGLKQTEEHESRIAEYIHESSKPLARYKDDTDLDRMLRNQEREGDPMLAYMREKKGEQGGKDEKPMYKGSYPANRFNIRPGYRWDGVDRSSGFEKTYFETQSKRKANDADAYKWSVEEM